MKQYCTYCQAHRDVVDMDRMMNCVIWDKDVLFFCRDRHCMKLYLERKEDEQCRASGMPTSSSPESANSSAATTAERPLYVGLTR